MTDYFQQLRDRVASREAVVGIVGLGYVGLPLARHFLDAGFRVLGIDTNDAKVARLRAGESYLRHIPADFAPPAIQEQRFLPSVSYDPLSEADAILICVPTPLSPHREPDLSFVTTAAWEIARCMKPGTLVSLESTTYPGTTEEVLLPLLSEGREVGRDLFLAFSPEREDPGNTTYTIANIPKVIGGVTLACTELAAALYGVIFERTVLVSRPAAAELSKLLENIFRSVNIALVNELKMLCDRMGLDVWEIIDAAATKPFGYMPFYPGPGLGGHCIPIDPFYLTWKAREYGFSTRFIELSGEINTSMPNYVVSRMMQALNERGRPVNGARILVLGAAYKKDVDDLRESPSIRLIQLLQRLGAEVCYNDPYIPEIQLCGTQPVTIKSVPLTAETLAGSDAVLVATAHSCYDPEFILEHAPLVVDTRNMTRNARLHRDKIVRA